MKPLPPIERIKLTYKYEDGKLSNLKRPSKKAGCLRYDGYIQVSIDNSLYKAHRIIYKLHFPNFDESKQIDHIDGNRGNNKIENLRAVSAHENCKNLSIRRNNRTGYPGLLKVGNKWYVYLSTSNKCRWIGACGTKKEAIQLRKRAEKQKGFHPNHNKSPKYTYPHWRDIQKKNQV